MTRQVCCLVVALILALTQWAPAQSEKPYVMLVNGWLDGCAGGMTNVITFFKNQGVDPVVVPWNAVFSPDGQFYARTQDENPQNDRLFLQQGEQLLNGISAERPIILIGHSFGADSLLKLVPRLQRPVDLLVVIDPVRGGNEASFRMPGSYEPIPRNVRYFVNRWQENMPFPMNFNVPGALVVLDPATVSDQSPHNAMTHADGKAMLDLFGNMKRTGHQDIATDAYVQNLIIDYAQTAIRTKQTPAQATRTRRPLQVMKDGTTEWIFVDGIQVVLWDGRQAMLEVTDQGLQYGVNGTTSWVVPEDGYVYVKGWDRDASGAVTWHDYKLEVLGDNFNSGKNGELTWRTDKVFPFTDWQGDRWIVEIR